MRLRYTGRAKDDLDVAFEWYEDQRRGLGFEFIDCVEAAIETILQTPKLYAKQHDHLRRALVRRFPFSIFYTIEKISSRKDTQGLWGIEVRRAVRYE